MCVQFEAGVLNLQAMDHYQSRPVRDRATQQEVRLNVPRLNLPETTSLALVHGKLVFHESRP